MQSTLDDSDTPMPMPMPTSSTPSPQADVHDHDLDPTLDLTSESPLLIPDTPPPTGSSSLFPQSASANASQTTHQRPHPSHATLGMETPPPSAAAAIHFHHNPQLMTPGPMSTIPSSQGLMRESSMLGMVGGGGGQMLEGVSRKSVAEAWAAAGWGGKKVVEEYEAHRDRLLDGGLSLAFLGDDYDESDMWSVN